MLTPEDFRKDPDATVEQAVEFSFILANGVALEMQRAADAAGVSKGLLLQVASVLFTQMAEAAIPKEIEGAIALRDINSPLVPAALRGLSDEELEQDVRAFYAKIRKWVEDSCETEYAEIDPLPLPSPHGKEVH